MSLYAVSAVFSGIVFRPLEFKAEDLLVGNRLIDLLYFMIKYQDKIFFGTELGEEIRFMI